eukprot:c26688_g1_i1.p1 GENE.c26688_g1_i1~~c26688_g1_i1.p1  ORF type:complete len:207 (+),score=47.88 c26688_g1_i1:518-1138(+)
MSFNTLEEARSAPALHLVDLHSFSDYHFSINTQNISKKGKFVLSLSVTHMAAYMHILEQTHLNRGDPDDVYMVTEDDVFYRPNFKSHFAEVYKLLPKDWEVVRLGVLGLTRDEDQVAGIPNLFRACEPFLDPKTNDYYYGGSFAVLVRPRTIPQLIAKLAHGELKDIDNMLGNFPTIRSYAFTFREGMVEHDHVMGDVERSHPDSE